MNRPIESSPLPKPPGWRLPLVATLALFALMVGGSIAGSAIHWAVTGKAMPEPTSYGFALMVMSTPLITGALLLFLVFVNDRRVVDQLGLRPVGLRSTAIAIVSALGISLAASSGAEVLGLDMGEWSRELMAASVGPWPQFLLMLLAGAVGAGVMEELFMRGYLQQRLARGLGPWAGIALTSLLFGAMHFYPLHIAFAALMGLMLGLISYSQRSTVPGIQAHVINNAASFVAVRLFGAETPTLSRIVVGPACLVALFGLFFFGRATWRRWREDRMSEVALREYVGAVPRFSFVPVAAVIQLPGSSAAA